MVRWMVDHCGCPARAPRLSDMRRRCAARGSSVRYTRWPNPMIFRFCASAPWIHASARSGLLCHQSAGYRLCAVDVAIIIVFIHAAHKVGEVIKNVVAGMGQDQSNGEGQPRQETERTVAPGEEPRQR